MVYKILVVEDSPVVQNVLKHLLSQLTVYVPIVCSCYKEAEATLASQNGDEFFAAIVDLNLPDATNGEVVDLVLESGVSCIVLTGNFNDDLRLELLNKGVLDYITKDSRYSFDHVMKVIERLRKNQHIKALVADDSHTSRLFVKTLLEQYRFNVVEAEDGQQALAKLEEDPEIRLFITDHNMPLINGYDLVRMLRHNNRFKDLVVIGLSTGHNSALSAKFIKAGANDFLKKPFYHEEFHCRITHNLESQEMLETIRDLANIDVLTKLKNRRYLFDEGESFYQQALSHGDGGGFAMIDIDHFKFVNDTYGHMIGDSLLELVGKEISLAFPESLTCRFGGEEFCVVSNENDDVFEQKLVDFQASLRTKEFTGAKIKVTCSIGVCHQKQDSLDDAVRVADKKLYEAKNNGRDRIELD
ncbi:Response regulator PleD [Marinomonas spartinae]|uniref:GGDEF domain-containing response regulator n=1 Tax=Marinomonas spartinae TaxID=1792290 RepID=UPI000808F0C5|nr:response regulator [Marinomonas spartinae]SBS35466.1 Response regulator PleD [Marinomonas spartinae]